MTWRPIAEQTEQGWRDLEGAPVTRAEAMQQQRATTQARNTMTGLMQLLVWWPISEPRRAIVHGNPWTDAEGALIRAQGPRAAVLGRSPRAVAARARALRKGKA